MSPVLRRPLAGLAALGAAALIAGCGGGSDSSSADEFRQQADAICADAQERGQTLTEPTTGDEVLPFLQAALPIGAEELERIGALDPPDDLQAGFEEAQDLIRQEQDLIQQAADRISDGEDPQVVITEVSPQIKRLQEEARTKARELGLTVCGSEGEDSGATTAPDTTGTAPGATGTAAESRGGGTAQYQKDVRAAVGALGSFSEVLQGTTSLDDLRAKVPAARSELDAFDDAIDKIEGYRLDNATLEGQRARVSESAPRVSDVLRRFLDAAATGGAEAVQALVPEVTQAVSDFQAAVTTSP